ncbi:hypothetical protein FHS74_001787 [Nitrospirillum iridis]|uniref:Uncharacterized protein n=1 Tax=Nitrospirillum iridis TaxID=765888 RepID=A0A7X0AW63_9PROT|nr:hypothetical protein [Nitrospirillum iridis]
MSNPQDDRKGDPGATIGSPQPRGNAVSPCTVADIALARAAEMLSRIRGTRAYADASPAERLALESYVLDLADIRSENGIVPARR